MLVCFNCQAPLNRDIDENVHHEDASLDAQHEPVIAVLPVSY